MYTTDSFASAYTSLSTVGSALSHLSDITTSHSDFAFYFQFENASNKNLYLEIGQLYCEAYNNATSKNDFELLKDKVVIINLFKTAAASIILRNSVTQFKSTEYAPFKPALNSLYTDFKHLNISDESNYNICNYKTLKEIEPNETILCFAIKYGKMICWIK